MNEVKRDNETLREIKQFQLSIENLVCDYPPILPPLIPKSWDTPKAVLEERMVYLQLSGIRHWFSPLCFCLAFTLVWCHPWPQRCWGSSVACLPPSLRLPLPLLPGVPEDNKESLSLGDPDRKSSFELLVVLTRAKEWEARRRSVVQGDALKWIVQRWVRSTLCVQEAD